MPAVRVTGLLAGHKAKQKTAKSISKATTSVPFKSAEIITDSDETDDADLLPPKARAPPKPKKHPASPPPHKHILSNGRSKKEGKSDRSASLVSKDTTTDDSRSNSRRPLSQGNTESEGSSSAENNTPTPVTRELAASVSSTSAKPSLKASKDKKPSKNRRSSQKHENRRTGSSEDESRSDASDESLNSGDGIDTRKIEREKSREDVVTPENTTAPSKTDSFAKQRKIAPYDPPPGFEPATISFNPSSRIDEIFAPSNTKGKQIWHITAPRALPLSSLKQISTQSIARGSAILSYDGAEYAFVTDLGGSDRSQKVLLLPSSGDNQYNPSRSPIAKNLRLQQLVKLPSRTVNPQSSINDTSSPPKRASKPRIEQPKGLKMRSHAFGIPGAGVSTSGSDSETEQFHRKQHKTPQFIHPDTPKPSKKRKHSEVANGVPTPPTSTLKPPKLPKSPSGKGALSLTPEPEKDTQRQASSDQGEVNGTSSPHTTTLSNKKKEKEKETKEERAKRKAEKHQKKLLQPFRVPRSASPGKAIPNGVHHSEDAMMTNGDGEDGDLEEEAAAGSHIGISRDMAGPVDDDDDIGDMIEDAHGSSVPIDHGAPIERMAGTAEERMRRKEEKRKRKEVRRLRREARAAAAVAGVAA